MPSGTTPKNGRPNKVRRLSQEEAKGTKCSKHNVVAPKVRHLDISCSKKAFITQGRTSNMTQGMRQLLNNSKEDQEGFTLVS